MIRTWRIMAFLAGGLVVLANSGLYAYGGEKACVGSLVGLFSSVFIIIWLSLDEHESKEASQRD